MKTEITSKLRIERVVTRIVMGSRAEFIVHCPAGDQGERWRACEAVFHDGKQLVRPSGFTVNPERAYAVAVAINMALGWLAEEMSR